MLGIHVIILVVAYNLLPKIKKWYMNEDTHATYLENT